RGQGDARSIDAAAGRPLSALCLGYERRIFDRGTSGRHRGAWRHAPPSAVVRARPSIHPRLDVARRRASRSRRRERRRRSGGFRRRSLRPSGRARAARALENWRSRSCAHQSVAVPARPWTSVVEAFWIQFVIGRVRLAALGYTLYNRATCAPILELALEVGCIIALPIVNDDVTSRRTPGVSGSSVP